MNKIQDQETTVHFWAICDKSGANDDTFSQSVSYRLKIFEDCLANDLSINLHTNLPSMEELSLYSADKHVVMLISTDPQAAKVFENVKQCFCIFAHCSPSDRSVIEITTCENESLKKRILELSDHIGTIQAKKGYEFDPDNVRVIFNAFVGYSEVFDVFEKINNQPGRYGQVDPMLGSVELKIDNVAILPDVQDLDYQGSIQWLAQIGASKTIINYYTNIVKATGRLIGTAYENGYVYRSLFNSREALKQEHKNDSAAYRQGLENLIKRFGIQYFSEEDEKDLFLKFEKASDITYCLSRKTSPFFVEAYFERHPEDKEKFRDLIIEYNKEVTPSFFQIEL